MTVSDSDCVACLLHEPAALRVFSGDHSCARIVDCLADASITSRCTASYTWAELRDGAAARRFGLLRPPRMQRAGCGGGRRRSHPSNTGCGASLARDAFSSGTDHVERVPEAGVGPVALDRRRAQRSAKPRCLCLSAVAPLRAAFPSSSELEHLARAIDRRRQSRMLQPVLLSDQPATVPRSEVWRTGLMGVNGVQAAMSSCYADRSASWRQSCSPGAIAR